MTTSSHQLELDISHGTHFTAYCSCGWHSQTYGPEWEATHDEEPGEAETAAIEAGSEHHAYLG